jgi:hypothetical protein
MILRYPPNQIAAAIQRACAEQQGLHQLAGSLTPGRSQAPGFARRTGPIVWNDLPPTIQQTIDWWLTGITDGGPQDREARQRLWAGNLVDHAGDHSAADMSFVSQMRRRGLLSDETDQALRASGLFRPKWDAKRGVTTYGERTLAKAAASAPRAPLRAKTLALSTTVATPLGGAVPRGAPLTMMPNFMSSTVAEAELDARLCKIADYYGAPGFGLFRPDGSVSRIKPADLPVLLTGHFVEVSDGKGGTKNVAAAVWWTQSPSKVVFDVARYDPENKYTAPGEVVLNTWHGLAIPAVKGRWRKMLRHIWAVLCGRNRLAFKYLIRWLAHVVQYPGTNPGTMIVLQSIMEGVGKSSLGQWMLRILGDHGIEVTDADRAFGQFNESMNEKSFVLLEELFFPGDHQKAALLKATITAKDLWINPKGHPAFKIPQTLHLMLTTNGSWAIPAGSAARRFLMLEINDLQPPPYFTVLWQEAESGGIAAMLYDLQRVNLLGWNPRDVPVTAALIEQQRLSEDDIAGWITDAVLDSCLVAGQLGGGFNMAWPSSDLHRSYLAWATTQGVRRPKSGRVFGRALRRMGLARGAGNNPPMWTIPDRAALLAASDRRSGIRKVATK